MKKLLSSALDYFVVNEDTEVEETKPKTVNNFSPSHPPVINPLGMSSPSSASTSTATVPTDGKMRERLQSDLQSKIAGSAFHQFQKICSSMRSKSLDTRTSVVAAGGALEAQGVTRDKIISGAQDALTFLSGLMQSESQNFMSELSKLDSTLLNRSSEIEASLKEKRDLIVSLSEQINNQTKEKAQLEISTQEEKTRLEGKKIEFEGAVNSLVLEISSEMNNITNFMGA